jgi:hypothetical protein
VSKPMVLDIVVRVQVADTQPQFIDAENLLTREGISIVAEAIRKEKALTLVSAELLDEEHCGFMGELGIPFHVGLEHPARVYECGSWSYPYAGKEWASGDNLGTLGRFVVDQIAKGKQQK